MRKKKNEEEEEEEERFERDAQYLSMHSDSRPLPYQSV
jgi:hypothetical protein